MSIEGVFHQTNYDSHVNSQRAVGATFQEDVPNFSVKQVRTILVGKESEIGNHWRDYNEVYSVLGEAKVTLKQVDTLEREEYELGTGERLFVPARTAIKIKADRGTVITCCSDSNDRKEGTHKFYITD